MERRGEEAQPVLLLGGTHPAQQGARPADHADGVLDTVERHVVVLIAGSLVAGPNEGKGILNTGASAVKTPVDAEDVQLRCQHLGDPWERHRVPHCRIGNYRPILG